MVDTNYSYVTELQPGTTLCGGRYTIENKIGAGGFGITYKAVQSGLGRAVCIKEYFPAGMCARDTQTKIVILQDVSEEMFEKYRLAFVREAQTLAQLHHQGIVEVIDVFDENGTSYMVMPFIEGRSLQSIVKQNGPLSYPEAVNYMAQVCNAVDYIHQRNILHRDIKPENIMVTADYKAILIDFGSAREFEQDKTQAHTSILTHGYAPPEQYSTISRKGSYSDIYSMGATLYFLLTGQVPVDVAARIAEDLPEPKELNPGIPNEANRTIMKAMELKGEDRHQTVQEFMDDLRNVKATEKRPKPIAEKHEKSQFASTPIFVQNHNRKKKTINKKTALLAAAAVLVLVSLVFLLIPKEQTQSNPLNDYGLYDANSGDENAEDVMVKLGDEISFNGSDTINEKINADVKNATDGEPEYLADSVIKDDLAVNSNDDLKPNPKNEKSTNTKEDTVRFKSAASNEAKKTAKQKGNEKLNNQKPITSLYFYWNSDRFKTKKKEKVAAVDSLIKRIEQGAKGFVIVGYASPEEDDPIAISELRAEAVMKAFHQRFKFGDDIEIEYTGKGVDWENLPYYIQKSNISNKEAILNRINASAKKSNAEKEETIRTFNCTYPGFDAEVLARMQRVDIYEIR